MGWLMNGATHGTIDVYGENMSNMCPMTNRKQGIRLIKSSALDNHSKLLKMELGQQIPIKSLHKMKRGIGKRRQTLFNSPVLRSNSFDHCYWYDQRVRKVSSLNAYGPIEYSLPNSKWGFFDECVTQKFFDTNPGQASLISYRDENNNVMGDIYSNANSYQCHCMDISGELMTFCIGGPRYFENNLPLENSPLWMEKNLAYDTHMKDISRDCKCVYSSPLFWIHYEYPTNPSLKGIVVNDLDNWWDIEERDSDIFEDPDEYGYVSTQLTHLPNCLGYNFGNVLSYLPINNLALSNELMCTSKCIELTPRLVMVKSYVKPKRCLLSLEWTKYLLHNNDYNNDSSDVHLSQNTLKWSEGFLGDCKTLFAPCRYEEPVRSIALDMDCAKTAIFEFNDCYYTSPPHPTYDSLDAGLNERIYHFYYSTNSRVPGRISWCLDNLCSESKPPMLDEPSKYIDSTQRWAWKQGNESIELDRCCRT